MVALGVAAALSACSAEPTTGTVWVANEGDGSLTAIDASSGEVVTTVTGLTEPHNVQAAADGAALWAVLGTDQLVALDAATAEVTGLAATDTHPAHVVESPDGGVLVASSGQPSVYSYDPRLRPLRRTALEGAPHGLRLSEDGSVAVVANTGAGTLDVVDVPSGSVRDRIVVGAGPVQTAVSPDGRTAWASVGGESLVVAVDLAGGEVSARRGVAARPAQVFLTSTGLLLVANQGDDAAPGSTLSVLDARTLEPVREVTVGAGPHGVVSDPRGRTAWVTNLYDDTVSVVDLASGRVTATVPVGDQPNGVSFSPVTVAADVPGTVTLDLPGREDRGDGHGDGHDDDH